MNRILFLSAHPDDFETGAGGFFARIKQKGGADYFNLVFSECSEQKGNDGIVQEFHESMKILGIEKGKFQLLDFPNTKFPESAAKIREAMERIRDDFKPDTIFTHDIENLHQDHKCVSEQALRVFKIQSMIMYQDIKSTPHFMPNMFAQLTKEQLERKIKALECYKTQFRRYYHDTEFVRAMARVHGKRINAEFAEAFRAYQYSI
ncbi:MAG: PIG-L family deacetylase [Candidatus Aenigmarchaeota archaeon]|nr:PIG-L family deacetylase [Candidatus Aenigmarchaeota archaeon]